MQDQHLSDAASLIESRGRLEVEISGDMHERDGMFKGDLKHYLSCGRDALFNIALAQASARAAPPSRILDFACGFGRVARHLRSAWPDASITFSDAMPEAAGFCAETFSGISKPVAKDFSGYAPGGKFDLIWVGSLFTHLPEAKSKTLFRILAELLVPGGLIVFTSHGRYVKHRRSAGKWPYAITAEEYDRMIGDAEATGFGFVGYQGSSDYGISLVELGWWEREIDRCPKLEMVMLRERGWDRHQDMIAVHRSR